MSGVIGVLALQGAFEAHEAVLRGMGCQTQQVRTPDDLAKVDSLVLPGGESTTMSHLLVTSGLFDPLQARIDDHLPMFGTCAGMILLSAHIEDGRPDQRCFSAIDIDARRNAYGRQIDSFETDLAVQGIDGDFHAVFIRAPQVVRYGPGVNILARHDDDVVLAREGAVLVASFHPELTDDNRIHRLFIEMLQEV